MKSSRGIENQRRLTGISRLLHRRFLRILPSLAGMVVALSLLSSSLLLPSPAFASDSTVEGSSVTVPSGDTIITQFQSGHGFIHTSGPGSSQDDTGVFCQGNQSLRITTDGNGSQSTVVMKKDISPTIDLTGKDIKVVLMVDDATRLPTSLGQVVFGFSSSNFSGNYIEMRATYTVSHQGPGGTWITTSLSQSGATVVGTPNLAAINSVRMYFRDGGTGPLNIWVQEIAYFTPNLDHGVVSFTFDDGYASNYTSALPVLSSYDYPATSYVARDNIGLSGSKWMNLAQLQALQNIYGWDIAAHGDINLSTLNAADCEAEIQSIKAWLEANGFNGGDYLAYPNGGLNTNVVLPLVQQYFINARLSNSQASETIPSGNQYALYSYAVTPAVTPAMVAARVAAAMANHDWLILVFHDIVDSGASGTVQYNLADFNAIVDNIHSQGIAVKSVSQVDKLADPSNLQVTGATEDSISLSWTKGFSADYTTIVAKQGSYPENVTDGTQIYTGTGNSTVHTSLSSCSIWYYRAWSYNSISGEYSTGYSSAIGAMTCDLASVITSSPSYVGTMSATLAGNIIASGIGDETVTDYAFVWDISGGRAAPSGAPPGTYAYSWTSDPGSYGPGTYDSGSNITGLSRGTTYYFRFGAHNAAGWSWGDEISFTTTPSENIITQFQSGHGFIHTSGPGSSQDDTSVFSLGNQSLRITTGGNGTSDPSTVVMKTDISPTIDLTGKAIKVVFMVDDSTRLPTSTGQIAFDFSSNNFRGGGGDYVEMRATYTASVQGPGGTWITTYLSQSGAEGAFTNGTPNLAAINSIRMYFRDGGTGPLNVWVQEISCFTPTLDHGIVSFTFDDGSASDYTRALPILSAYDYPATAYVARENIGLSGSDWMNMAQLQALQNTYGWDVAAHGSINLSTLNAADCKAEIQAIKTWLASNGFNGGNYIAYPNGGLNTNIVLPLVQQYFTNARLSSSQASETFPSGNQYALYAYEVKPGVTPAMVAARVAAAMANHDWLILVFHDLVDSGATGGSYNVDDFAAIVDNINSQGITVKSVSQVSNFTDPSNLHVTGATEDSISLSWTKGASADYTTIVAKQGSYPENVTDGTQIYTGTGNSTVHTSLSGCSTWYYRAWSYNSISGEYSTGFSSAIGATICDLPQQVVITPATATITADGTQTYTTEAFDQYGNSLGDTTSATIFSAEVAAGGSWSGNVYTSEKEGTWTVTGDYNGQTVTATLTVTAASPAMTSVNPNQGYQGQTLSVAIAGNNLTGATSVSFGSGITVDSFTVDSATQITANITIDAAATTGARDVSVTTPGGTATNSAGFTVNKPPAPTISTISPSSGVLGQTLSVTITGTNFTGTTSISFGSGITVDSFTVDSATQITANITIDAAATTGARDVSVTTPGGTATNSAGFTVNKPPAPTISTISPSSGVLGQTLSVTITGTNFTGTTSISFGSGITVDSFTVDSATQITANITIDAAATTGARDVSVTTPGGTATNSAGFTVNKPPAPTISTISPSSGVLGQTLSVTITGTNFAGTTSVSFSSGITVDSFTVDSATQITANITISGSAKTGNRNVSVTTPGGTTTKSAGFTVNKPPAPTISTINPSSGVRGQTLSVTIIGTNFTGTTSVSFGSGITVDSFTVDSATQITANITISGSAKTGNRNVSVTTPGGTATKSAGFTVNKPPAPTISTISPSSGVRGQTLSVTIIGTNFTGTTSVSFGSGITVSNFTVDSATQITANITISGSAKTGNRNVSVTTPGGTATKSAGFKVN